jgi:hypothetical protein
MKKHPTGPSRPLDMKTVVKRATEAEIKISFMNFI